MNNSRYNSLMEVIPSQQNAFDIYFSMKCTKIKQSPLPNCHTSYHRYHTYLSFFIIVYQWEKWLVSPNRAQGSYMIYKSKVVQHYCTGVNNLKFAYFPCCRQSNNSSLWPIESNCSVSLSGKICALQTCFWTFLRKIQSLILRNHLCLRWPWYFVSCMFLPTLKTN